jgi:hypothetical protein
MSNNISLKTLAAFSCLLVSFGLSGCAMNTFWVDQVAKAVVTEDSQEEDLMLARDASPFYLKLTENLLASSPANLKLAESVSAGFTQYAYAFIAFEADKLEARDYKGAEVLRERASKMYARAYRHALKAFDLKFSGFEARLRSADEFKGGSLGASHVGLLYWTAASLGGWISTAKDQPDVVADFPVAQRLAHLAWGLNPTYSQGSLASLMGSFEWADPNGSKSKATQYFDLAIEYAKESNAGPYVSKAERVAVSLKDKAMFESLLHKAIAIAQKTPSLQNETMRLRALWLLENEEDLIESE